MRSLILAVAALGLVAVSLLTSLMAPGWVWSWKLAILAGEFGHWLALAPVAVALAAWFSLRRRVALPVVLLSAVAVAGFVRPWQQAAQIATHLDSDLAQAFGGKLSQAGAPGGHAPPSAPVFSALRLFPFPREPAADVVTEVFARPGGVDLRLDFYRPLRRLRELAPDQGPAPAPPCVIVIHGGGWDEGDRVQLPGLNRRLAARGYAVASLDYRLAPRWQWPAARDDVLAGIAWLKANAGRLGIDPGNLVLFGRSAGGQLAEVVAYAEPDPAIRGLISFYGPSDLDFGYRHTTEDDAIHSPALMRAYLGGTPDTRPEQYRAASALNFVTKSAPPTLLVHGRLDTLVWDRHDERLAARLTELGVRHFYLALPWATHGFDYNPVGPGGQLSDAAVFGFLEAVTGGTGE